MKCPVCKTECGNYSTCPECGFSGVGKLFVNQDDAEQWLDSVVSPFRLAYEKSNILPPLDWVEILKQDPRAKSLFEITIPAAKRRQASLEYIAPNDPRLTPEIEEHQRQAAADAVLGHIVLRSTNELVDRHFIDEVNKAMGQYDAIKTVTLNGQLKPGDLAAVLTTLKNNALVVFEFLGSMKTELLEILSLALSEFTLPVTLGKGPMAKSFHVELPTFTAIFVVKRINDIPSSLISSFDSVIEPTFSKEDLLEYQIRKIAAEYEVVLSRSTLDLLKELLLMSNVKPALRLIADYLFLNQEINQPINSDKMREILKNIS